MKDIAIALISGSLGTTLGICAMAVLAAGRQGWGSPAGPPPNYTNWGR